MKFKLAIITFILGLVLIPSVSSAQVRNIHLEQQLQTLELLLAQIRSRLGVVPGYPQPHIPAPSYPPGYSIEPLYIRITGPEELDRNERGEWRVRTEGDGDLTLYIDWDDGDDSLEEVEDRETEEFTHRYDRRGSYDIVFTLENDLGRRVTESMRVDVDDRARQRDHDIEEIQITISNNRAYVTIEFEDGDTDRFTLNTDDEDDIIEELAERLDIDEDDLEDMIEWEDDGRNNDFRIASVDPDNGEEGDTVELDIRDIDEDDEDEVEVYFDGERLNSRDWDIDFSSNDRATIEFEIPDVREGRYSVWIEVDGERSNRVTFEVED